LVVIAALGGIAVLHGHGAGSFPPVSAVASILDARAAHARRTAPAPRWRRALPPPVLPSEPTRSAVAAIATTTHTAVALARKAIAARRGAPGAGPTRPGGAAVVSSTGAAPATPRPLACPLYTSNTSIYIPRLGVRAPVYDCDTAADGTLPIAPGYAVTHWRSSATLGGGDSWKNYVIYGHDDIERNIFQQLPAMQVGDEVYLYQGGRGYVYVVTGSKVVEPTDTAVLYQTPTSTLTMISCYPFDVDSQRIVVRAALARTGHA